MALMTGTYTKQIDRKGRVGVPAPLRSLLLPDGAAEFKVRTVVDRPALEALTVATLEEQHNVIYRKMPMGSEEQDEALETYISAARSVTPDAEGRIVLPTDFREHLGDPSEITFVGRGVAVQIWDAETYAARVAERRKTRKPVVLPILDGGTA